MRQPDPKRRRRTATGGARTYLQARLGWLDGFPLGIDPGGTLLWQIVPALGLTEEPRAVAVDRELLRRTEFSVRRAPAKFPDALSAVVGDIARWRRRIDQRLAHLKRTVHNGDPLPATENILNEIGLRRHIRDRAQSVSASDTLVAAIAWRHWDDHAALERKLGAIEAHRTALALAVLHMPGHGFPRLIRLIDLLSEGDGEGIARVFADPDFWTVPTASGGLLTKLKNAVDEFERHRKTPTFRWRQLDRPAPTAPDLASRVIETAARAPARQRHAITKLVAVLLAGERRAEWRVWWHRFAKVEQRLRRHVGRHRLLSKKHSTPSAKELRRAISALREELPPRGAGPDAWELIAQVSQRPEVAAQLAGMVSGLAERADGGALSGVLLRSWIENTEQFSGRDRVLLEIARELGRLATHLPDDERAASGSLDRSISEALEHWATGDTPKRHFSASFAAARMLLDLRRGAEPNGQAINWLDWDIIPQALESGSGPEDVARLLAVVPCESVAPETWLACLRIVRGNRARLRTLVDACSQGEFAAGVLARIIDGASDLEWDLIAGALDAGESKALLRLIAVASLVSVFGGDRRLPEPPVDRATIDLTPYPAALHDGLRDLAGWDDDASRSADRILGRNFPRPGDLRREIEMLEKLIRERPAERDGLVPRLENLKGRLARPTDVSPKRLERLNAKIADRVRAARMGAWRAALISQLRLKLAGRLEREPDESWFDDPERSEVLGAIANLSRGFQTLAWRLLGARTGPPPWDLREAPANAAFLRRMRRAGLNMDPWLDGIGVREARFDGRAVTLDLAGDPFDVLRMGAPFSTCLSPGSFNFFSAVANAVDINKRVIFARDGDGKVRARCLVCLTDAGEIVTFHVYTHEPPDEPREAVRQFVLDLAGALGARIATGGKIARLVAPDWYDDGPFDLIGQFAAVQNGSAFAGALETIAPGKVTAALKNALGDFPPTPSLLSTVLRLPVIRRRPELLPPLLTMLDGAEALDPHARMEIALAFGMTGQRQRALAILSGVLRGLTADNVWFFVSLATAFLDLGAPVEAMRVLRRVRTLGRYGYPENRPEFHALLGRTLEALSRPRQALDAYIRAKDGGMPNLSDAIANLERKLQRLDM